MTRTQRWKLAGLLALLALLAGPGCDRGPGEAPAAAAGQPEVVGNATCPVSGQPVGGSAASPTFHSDFRGKRVGFMCPTCKAQFDSAPEAQKLELTNKALRIAGKPPLP